MSQFNASEILASSKAPAAAEPASDNQALMGTPGEDGSLEIPGQKPGNDFDSKFQLLAKMERKMKEKESQFSSKSKEWEEKDLKLKEMQEYMDLLESNPLEAIKKKKGWGLKELNEYAVQNNSDEEMDPVAQITNQFTKQMEEMKKMLQEDFDNKLKAKEDEIVKKDYDGQIKEFKSGLKSFLSENKDTYEYVMAEDQGMDLVYDVIYQDLMEQKDSGANELKLMDTKEAADIVEAYLEKAHSKYLGLNKVKKKFTTPSDGLDLSKVITQSESKTLNNSFAPKSKSLDQLDPEERIKAAEALVKSWVG